MQGRVTEADQLLDGVETADLSEGQRERVTYGRRLGELGLGDAAEAAALITGAADDIGSRRLQGLSAQALMLDGRIDEAMAVARRCSPTNPATRFHGCSRHLPWSPAVPTPAASTTPTQSFRPASPSLRPLGRNCPKASLG